MSTPKDVIKKGHKGNFDKFKADDQKNQAARSANLTQIGTIPRKLKGDSIIEERKKWVKKTLDSRQEVLIECITGEIYRYVIGSYQPKIRTGDLHNILSEFVPYCSIRDITDKGEPKAKEGEQELSKEQIKQAKIHLKQKAAKFKEAFLAQQRGFMLVLFSSIMLEENDLSDQNYGLAIPADANGNILDKSGTAFLEFIKIDHGQSLNYMRIERTHRKPLSLAPVKYFPPNTEDVDYRGVDSRTKDDRSQIYRTRRKYNITPEFIDRCIIHFLSGYINKDCILDLNYQPSTLPLFDGRLLVFYRDLGNKYNICEEAKYWALAKLVFTRNDVYMGIAKRATADTEDVDGLEGLQKRIRTKIIDNKLALLDAISSDPDFLMYCYINKDEISEDINNSFDRITHKRPVNNNPGKASDRYKDLIGTLAVSPNLNGGAVIGKYFADLYNDHDFREAADLLFKELSEDIESTDWKVRGIKGGVEITCSDGTKKRVPDNIADIHISCDRYIKAPLYRLFRTFLDVSCTCYYTQNHTSLFRAKETQTFYATTLQKLQKLCTVPTDKKGQRTLKYLMAKYEKGEERYFDFYKDYSSHKLYREIGN